MSKYTYEKIIIKSKELIVNSGSLYSHEYQADEVRQLAQSPFQTKGILLGDLRPRHSSRHRDPLISNPSHSKNLKVTYYITEWEILMMLKSLETLMALLILCFLLKLLLDQLLKDSFTYRIYFSKVTQMNKLFFQIHYVEIKINNEFNRNSMFKNLIFYSYM